MLNVQIIDENEISNAIFHCKNETKIYTRNNQSIFLYVIKDSNGKKYNIIEYDKLIITKEEIEFYMNKINNVDNYSIIGCINQDKINLQIVESLYLLIPYEEELKSERKENLNENLPSFGIRKNEIKKKDNIFTASQLGLAEINEMEISSSSFSNKNKKNNNTNMDSLKDNLELSKAENRIKELIEENTKLKELLKKYENDILEEKQEKLNLLEENSKLREQIKE